jgi:hypothetical protein
LSPQLVTAIAVLDRVLDEYAAELGGDFAGYRNHTYRVANLCFALSSGNPERLEKIAIAAAFHDIGIWVDGTFDYLPPSVRLATAHLERSERTEWVPEICEIIQQHHKLSQYRNNPSWLVESFRRADLVDVSRGLFRFGLPRSFVRALFSQWPSAGFHWGLVRLELRRLRTNPLSPLPMVRL